MADIRDILVVVDELSSLSGRLDGAIYAAGLFGARLTGLFVAALPDLPSYVEARLPESLRQERDAALKDAAADAEAVFSDKAAKASLDHGWRAIIGRFDQVALVAAGYAHVSDLAVVGRNGADQPHGAFGLTLAEHLVLSSGRPVLAWPPDYTSAEFGKRIVIGWNGCREAARALRDAIPFLQSADDVSLLTVETARSAENTVLQWDEITTYLNRHGIDATIRQSLVGAGAAGDVILSRAREANADMIVMGAYGYSRLREVSFGGTTRHVMQNADVPVLLSH